jgi:polar amino acid transport system substrate-binding protein
LPGLLVAIVSGEIMNRRLTAALSTALLLTGLGLGACAPQEEPAPSARAGCGKADLRLVTKGTFTIGTDRPAYEPWFSADDPANGKGFESAVGYAVAQRLGFARADVTWATVPFNNAIAPGPKKFDVDINQVSISPERRNAVDFSSGYYDVRQAVIALETGRLATATTVADLRGAKLGAQVGTTSLEVIENVIKPTTAPAVYQRNDLAKTALKNRQVDGIVVDLPTAFYITGAEVPEAKIVGQFPGGAAPEQFGLVLDKGSPLTSCVSKAVDSLRADGTLAELEQQWLADVAGAPVLR